MKDAQHFIVQWLCMVWLVWTIVGCAPRVVHVAPAELTAIHAMPDEPAFPLANGQESRKGSA